MLTPDKNLFNTKGALLTSKVLLGGGSGAALQ